MNTATINLNGIIGDIRAEGLDVSDLRDIAASIDAGETEYIAVRGCDTWLAMTLTSMFYDISAEELAEDVTVAIGW